MLYLTSCAGVKIEQVAQHNDLEHVCIQRNPKVIVGDFLQILVEVLGERNIRSKVFLPTTTATIVEYDINGKVVPDKSIPKIQDECDYYITYVANMEWDMAMYMSKAEINLYNRYDKLTGYGEYDRGAVGLDLSKFNSTKFKLRTIIDGIFSNYPLTDEAIRKREKERQQKLKEAEENH